VHRRYRDAARPGLPRPYRTPLVPILGILVCFAMMASLDSDTWVRLFVWLAIGLAIYFGYSRHHSLLAKKP
jgi:basic amino acid/polyamine antiporter, APA family